MPAELHAEVIGLLDTADGIRRRAGGISRAYASLDALGLAVDELGPEASATDVLDAARLALATIDDALLCVVDSIYDAMRHTSRLKETEE